ncbi:ATP-binding protein [Blastococcus deserti]|uniref:ATP-binding protein n=1 Tax=Blastococcus deserti TaxID=2259033 RepID=A0ABW4XEL9_9ACTN
MDRTGEGAGAATKPDELRVRLFGGVHVDGVPPADLGTRKARTLLGVLAAADGRSVPLERLTAAVWPEHLPARPVDQLGVLVSRLRRAIGPERIRRVGAGYALDGVRTDLAEFARHADEAEAALAAGSPARALARARTALDLADGELLLGESGEWVDGERRAAARRCMRLRLVLAEAAVVTGEPRRAVAAAQEVLDADPYDEEALRVLMRAQAAAGKRAAALAAFAELRARLAGELGTDPAAATAELHARLLRGEPAPPVLASPGTVPAGRGPELARLAARLQDAAAGATCVVVVRGEPGIGKTVLLDAFLAAAAPSACVLHGHCDILGRDLPLQPLLDGLEVLLRGLDQSSASAVLAADAAAVAPLLGRVDDALPPTEPVTVPVPSDAGHARAQLFAALLRVLRRAAGERPLVVAVDDLHMAGPSTLEWLRFAARRGERLLVVGTTRPVPIDLPDGAEHLDLGPLDLAAVAEIVGEERAPRLWKRSGGSPLLLQALAASEDDGPLPGTVRDAVEPVLAALGPAGPTVRSAAVLGPEVDLELLADVTEMPAGAVLDHLEAGLRLRLLTDRGGRLRFTHEPVREVAATAAGAARAAFLHRRAATVLAARGRSDPLRVAWHARLGGDARLASAQLVRAARLAVARSDLAAAERLLDQAAALDASAEVHLVRADVLLRRDDLSGAGAAAETAIAAGAGAAGYELAGWTAYYQRDHGRALRFAALGAGHAGDADARAACAALAGRIRHSRGDLTAAEEDLTAALAAAPGSRDGMQRVWLAALRAHQGRPAEALELTEQALVDPAGIRHPYAAGHGHFAQAYALGMLGRPLHALASLDAADRAADRGIPGMQRMAAVIHNMRGWVLRGLGELEAADDQHAAALAWTDFPGLPEPHAQAGLDLVESALLAGDADEARARLAQARLQPADHGTMVWHQRERHALLTARIALLDGRFGDAEEAAAGVLAGGTPGSRRHELVARVLLAAARDAAGDPVDPAQVEPVLASLDQVAGLESWRWTALAGRYLAVPRWADLAERRVVALAVRAGEHRDALCRFADRWLAAPTA